MHFIDIGSNTAWVRRGQTNVRSPQTSGEAFDREGRSDRAKSDMAVWIRGLGYKRTIARGDNDPAVFGVAPDIHQTAGTKSWKYIVQELLSVRCIDVDITRGQERY